ncbi:ATP-grasp fold amidoligase family protein [Natronoarchaeum sp. GCM10025703]|uniref:ATP-grasp fold amidoligase family protein n=1 Tax=unclassified Natronoarchaeum TaxID=2620183 RepID=UPI0036232E6C
MTYLAKLQKTARHRGVIPTVRHGVRFTIQKAGYPVFSKILSPKTHEKLMAAPVLGYWPQLEEPRSFSEKIISRKLSGERAELFSTVSDKYSVREYVKQKVGENLLTDLYFVGESSGEIPKNGLPEKFVIKATHGSGMTIVVDDHREYDFDLIESKCKSWLETPFGKKSREYWYEEIQPRVVIEEYIDDPKHDIPPDFKFYVFNGRVEFVHVDFNRFSAERSRRFFDREWNACDFRLDYPLGPTIDKPDRLDEMIKIAETLGEDFEFVRVDLYHTSDNRIYFGEMTLAPAAGTERFYPVEWDFKLGSYW